MDFSKDVNEITRFIKESEIEASEHRKRQQAGPVADPKTAKHVLEIVSDLRTQVKVWLNHMAAASKYPFQHEVAPTSEAAFDVHLGNEVVSVILDSPARLDIRDHTTGVATMLVYPNPFFDGLTPVLVDAVKRDLSRQIRAQAR